MDRDRENTEWTNISEQEDQSHQRPIEQYLNPSYEGQNSAYDAAIEQAEALGLDEVTEFGFEQLRPPQTTSVYENLEGFLVVDDLDNEDPVRVAYGEGVVAVKKENNKAERDGIEIADKVEVRRTVFDEFTENSLRPKIMF